MKWKMATPKPTKITRVATTPRHGLEHYCRDLNSWPHSWMGLEKDLPPGEQLITLIRPFLEHLAMSDLSPKTIQKHVDNLWVLGGELITELNYTPFVFVARGKYLVAFVQALLRLPGDLLGFFAERQVFLPS